MSHPDHHHHLTRHGPDEVLPVHRHAEAYAALVLDGEHEEASVDGRFHCTPGSLVLHPRWHAHGNRFGRSGGRVANLPLAPGTPTGSVPGALRLLRVPDLREAREIFARASHRLGELVAASVPLEPVAPHAWQVPFLAALADEDVDIARLARRAGVSAAHASRSFVRSHGMPPQLLRRELRTRRALALLGGGSTLAEIASQCGFADQSHLARTLVAATGAPPSRLRAGIKCVQDAGRESRCNGREGVRRASGRSER